MGSWYLWITYSTSWHASYPGCDGIIGLGGGSPIDLAKGVALAATHDGLLNAYAAIEGGAARITSAVAPVIAIPTTAGTGSENAAEHAEEERHRSDPACALDVDVALDLQIAKCQAQAGANFWAKVDFLAANSYPVHQPSP